ncbi:hypothetical protein ES703_53446 [subsurface metagenome]
MTKNLVNCAIFLIIGVVILLVSFISSAILPISVCSLVPTTIPCPEPLVMKVPLNVIQCWSAGGRFGLEMGSTFFFTGTDSPVSAASSASKFFV